VQHAAGVQAEHLPTDDGRGAGEVSERDHPQDPLRLGDDVVVEQQAVGAVALDHRLVHRPREAAGAAQVGLVDHAHPAAEPFRRSGVPWVVHDLLGPLVDDQDLVEDREHLRLVAERLQLVDAERGPVEGRDPDGDRPLRGSVGVGHPLTGQQLQSRTVGRQVEPVPAAVYERLQRQVELDCLRLGAPHLAGLDPHHVALGGRPLHDHRTRADQPQPQPYRRDGAPALPVPGGEGVEVRPQGQDVAVAHGQAVPPGHGRGGGHRRTLGAADGVVRWRRGVARVGLATGLRTGQGTGPYLVGALVHSGLDVQGKDVVVGVQREHDPLQHPLTRGRLPLHGLSVHVTSFGRRRYAS